MKKRRVRHGWKIVLKVDMIHLSIMQLFITLGAGTMPINQDVTEKKRLKQHQLVTKLQSGELNTTEDGFSHVTLIERRLMFDQLPHLHIS